MGDGLAGQERERNAVSAESGAGRDKGRGKKRQVRREDAVPLGEVLRLSARERSQHGEGGHFGTEADVLLCASALRERVGLTIYKKNHLQNRFFRVFNKINIIFSLFL